MPPSVIPDPLSWAHPLVAEWFVSRFGTPTEPQEQGWPHILAGRTTLISAPTGSGKTLAAFLICIDRLVRKALDGDLRDCTEVLYVSPLKALGNDIQKNLEGPLGEILALAGERGFLMPEIRTAVRTGDTLMKERREMLKRPPHILVTTPESLYILLTANSSRTMLSHVKTVIVDEIHAVADDKRGAHLALSLERLDLLANRPTRIGLSATQKPLEDVAHFLTGADRPMPAIVNIGHRRQLDIAVEVPRSELGPIATNEMWGEIYDRLAELALQHRSTLVFVNTRTLAERVALHLGERIGEDQVAAHHGSLARKMRLNAERKLKNGEIRLLVATASLELGIDIGTVDLVCQINSPRSIAVALQRVGRAGHWRGAISKGRFFATTRDDLLECAATVRAIRQGDLDVLHIPESPLDILAQQIVAMCACEDWDEDELFDCVRRAYPNRELRREDYDRILEMLSQGIAAKRGRYGAYLFRDMVNRRLRARRGARLAAITSGGAIPDTAMFTVVAQPEEIVVGTVDEDFAVESNAGDIMLLGNTSWRIRRVSSNTGRMIVEDAHGAPPTIPFWRGEAPARTDELSLHVADLRERLSALLADTKPRAVPANPELEAAWATPKDLADDEIVAGLPRVEHPFRGVLNLASDSEPAFAGATARLRHRGIDSTPEVQTAVTWLDDECGLDASAAEQLIEYVVTGRAVLGDVPTQQTIIAERFFDEGGGMQLIIHAPFGGRINKAWGLALRKRFCRSFNYELQAAATDNGLNIALAEQHSFPLSDVFHYLQTETVQEILEQAALASPIFATRWRWDANRSLALLRFQGGKKVPPQIQRIRSDDLLASVFPDVAACPENLEGDIHIPDHPLIQEVMKDVLTEAMDIDGLRRVIDGIRSGAIRCLAVDTPVPSQFSHEILNANPYAYLDDAPLEERRARAVQMRRMLPEAVLNEVGRLDQQAIARIREEARPDVRDADELHDTLQTLVALPLEIGDQDWQQAVTSWMPLATELLENWRAVRATVGVQHPFRGALNPTSSDESALADDTKRQTYLIASERAKEFALIFPGAQFETAPPDLPSTTTNRDDALLAMISGWTMHTGPITANALAYWLGLTTADVDKALLRLEAAGTILRGNFTGQIAADNIEWCERRLLARIHHLTVATLRKQVEPVTAAQFMRWLLRWQHIAPQSQLSGERGLLQVLRQLQGFEIPANAWEKQILARRVHDYDPAALDQLCLTGAVGWGRLSPHPATLEDAGEGRHRVVPTSVAPITFFVREESDWMQPPPHRANSGRAGDPGPRLSADEQGFERVLSPGAQAVLEFLRRRGASFFADIVRGTGKLKAEVETALWELVAAGMVTADGFDNLRSLINPKRRAGQGSGRTSRPRHTPGRWSLLYGAENSDRTKVAEATCWMLLRRYGVVFREVLARESNLPKWRELLIAFRRLEDRGEVRGGRFVSGFLGEQFALPEAVESLRAMRNLPASGEIVTLSAADPLNLIGFIVPGERVAAISGKFVSFRDGVPVEPEERPSILREAVAQ